MIKVGNLGVGGERGDVFSVDGCCPAESATQYKDPIKAIEVIGLNEYDDGTCRTIKNQYYKNSIQNFESTGSYGCSGVVNAQSIRMVRTEEGKANRKAYESGELHMAFSEVKTEDVRSDGIANCVDTVQKDLRIVETKVPSIKIRQAVKNGFIECEVGGYAI